MKIQNKNIEKLIAILNDGDYHDGDSLGLELNMSRAAICKIVKKLVNYGIDINAIKGKGYQLTDPLILFDTNKVKKSLSKPTQKTFDLTIFETIASTNDFLKCPAAFNNKLMNICLAEEQTEGKGRLGRQWHSPFGQNICLSCRYSFKKDISELAGLSLIVGLATLKTIRKYTEKNTVFAKWPNDIVCHEKKLAGNLIEIIAETNGFCHAIIGIGINVNMITPTKKINQPWTSMRQITNTYFDRNQIAAELISNLLENLKLFEKNGLEPFIKEWKQHDCLMKKNITVTNNSKKISGQAININKQGHLILKLQNGEKQICSSGDTSVKKNN